ncbi:hypothetical protein CVT24_012899 [Panaeolus cyanescens]|uniref:D-arabinono-1,4-lactone oxidase C-terminal domain-containing protein n=1 Tax=Panaeolus cyanescens TaxID=181874 RepID=A0A409W2U7_9AGAR|nr:hypothetical protein CVT24_012899 [Panaeolus cyanescens]
MKRFSYSFLGFVGVASAIPWYTFDGPGFPACHNVSAVYTPSTIAEAAAIVKNASAAGIPVRAAGVSSSFPFLSLCCPGLTILIPPPPRDIVHLERDQTSDTWLAATTSLGLLGIIGRIKMEILADFKVYAQQDTINEKDVFEADIYKEISPYVTANYWWWPGVKKFHKRTYGVVPKWRLGNAFQSTFSVTETEANLAKALLDAGQNSSTQNFITEGIFYALWTPPNFHDKPTNIGLLFWPVIGWAYDVLIGGLYPNTKTQWDYGLRAYTFEVAVPVTQANRLFKRVRELFDEAAAEGKAVTSTYRSGINIKFGRPFDSLLGQTTTLQNDPSADWSKGAIMFDFPSYRPTTGGGRRYNEEWYVDIRSAFPAFDHLLHSLIDGTYYRRYHKLEKTLTDEFPTRPHWTKCTRTVLQQSLKNLDPALLARFAKVREEFDPQKTFKSVVGEIIGVV